MASQLLSVNIEFIDPSSTRMMNGLSFYSPSTILNLRNSLSENLCIPSNHFNFLRNGQPINDDFRLIDQHTYQVYLQLQTTPTTETTSSSPSIYIVFFYRQTIHILNVNKRKIYTCIDELKIGYSIVYVDWNTFDDDEEYEARISLKKDLSEEFGLDPTSSIFGIHQCPFQYIDTYQDFLEKYLEEEDEEEEQFEFDPEDDIDGDDEWN